MGRYATVNGQVVGLDKPKSKDPDKWLEAEILSYVKHFHPFGIHQRNIGSALFWGEGPDVLLTMSDREKRNLLDRVLRRLVRHGRLRTEKQSVNLTRWSRKDRRTRRATFHVNHYIAVDVLMAIAKAAV